TPATRRASSTRRAPVPDASAPARVRITLPIGGMSCAACTAHVADALKHVDGVDDASADLLTRTATVSFDSSKATPDALVAAVRGSGYDADLPNAHDALLERQRHDDVEQAHEARSLLVRALALLVAMVAMMLVMSVH